MNDMLNAFIFVLLGVVIGMCIGFAKSANLLEKNIKDGYLEYNKKIYKIEIYDELTTPEMERAIESR